MGKTQNILMALVALLGLGVTYWGFNNLEVVIEFDPIYKITSLGLSIVLIEFLSRWKKINPIYSGIILIIISALIASQIWPLLICFWFILSSYLFGLSIFSLLKIDEDKTSPIIAFIVGSGMYGSIISLAINYPINYPGVYAIGISLPLILNWNKIVRLIGSIKKTSENKKELHWLELAIATIGLAYILVAFMPEFSHDALAVHLFIPSHILSNHIWEFDVAKYVWAVMPALGDWIYTAVYILGGESAARILNVIYIFALCIIIRDVVVWCGGNEKGSRWAILLFLSTPLTFTESSSLFIEAIWASFLVSGLLMIFQLLLSTKINRQKYFPLIGLLLGCAIATKAVSFSFLPIFVLPFIFFAKQWLKLSITLDFVKGIVIFCVLGSIPYLTAWLITGNPVFPFFNEYFKSEYYPLENFSTGGVFEKGISWDTIYRVTFETGNFLESNFGGSGFQWLLMLPISVVAMIYCKSQKGIGLIFVGMLSIILTFQQTAYLRYIFPAVIILIIVMGIALSKSVIKSHIQNGIMMTLTCFSIVLNLLFIKTGTPYGDLNLSVIIDERERANYIGERLPIRNAVDVINNISIGPLPVAVFGPPLMAGLHGDPLYTNWYNYSFQSLIQKTEDKSSFINLILNEGVEYIILDNSWGDEEKRNLITNSTSEVWSKGPISVRTIRDEDRFNTENLLNQDFSNDEYWSMSVDTNERSANGIVVNNSQIATQLVSVNGNRSYEISLEASCLEGVAQGQGRLQVNWLNENSAFIDTNIDLFNCTDEKQWHSKVVLAPENSKYAVVYAGGHTEDKFVIYRASFKH